MYDVNAARKQRAEAHGKDFEFTVDGETFAIPLELRREVYNALRDVDGDDVDGTLRLLMGDAEFERLVKHNLSLQDLTGILREQQKLATPRGEAEASKSS